MTPVDEAFAELFQAPLSEFTRIRNRLADAVKNEGDAAGARQIKSTRKPMVSAWAVNQLFYRK